MGKENPDVIADWLISIRDTYYTLNTSEEECPSVWPAVKQLFEIVLELNIVIPIE